MSTLRVSILVERDGIPISGFPIVRRIIVDEDQTFHYEKADDGNGTDFSALPTDQVATIQALVVQTDRQVTLRLDGQTDAGLVLDVDGLLILVNAIVDAGASVNVKVNNDSDGVAVLRGLAAGT